MAEFLNEIELWTESGELLIVDLRNALIRSAAPDASTKGRQGMQCYVVSGNTISEEFVCTVVSGNRYTWVRRERQNTTVDTTLTVSGAAADAATVGEKLTEQNTKKADLDTVPNRAVMQGNTMKFQRSTVSNGATTTKNLFEVQIPTGGSSEGGTADGGGDGSLFPYIWKKYKGDPNTITYTDGSDVLYIAKRGYITGNRTTVYYSDEINTGMGGISLADPVQIDIPVTQDGAKTAAVLKGKYVTLGSNKNIYFIPEDARIIMAGSAPMYDIRATTYQTVEGAEFLGFVTAETSDAYPANGVDSTDGCWYVGGGLIADLTDINAAVDVDDTLMVSGAAADAAVVGKMVSELSEAIENLGGTLTEPAEDDIPKVFISGEKPTTKDDVLAEMQYISKSDNFHAYLEIKCQGSSSMSYAKKNFTVKLYSDEARETKLKKMFRNWNVESSKFVLKANWIDHSHARNVVSARLWGEVVTSRHDYDSLPAEMRNAPNNGAVDGFPVKVYYNGTYEGIYTWNIGKDDWMWGMDEDNPNHVLMCAEGNTNGVYAETASNFRALWDGVDGSSPGYSIEVGTNSNALKTSLNNLIQFVMDNDGDNFRNGIGNYLDIQSAIDYYLFQYVICGLDCLAHNMLLATYDLTKWRCGAYDLDSTFGLWWDGKSFVSTQYRCPEDYQEPFSLLWERIEALYVDELKTRYTELRAGVLSFHNIVTNFERFMDVIGSDLYAEDVAIYTSIPSASTNNIKQIRNYIRDRLAYVDAEISALAPPAEKIPCTGITLSATTLTFTESGSKTIAASVTPENTTDMVTWTSDNVSVATVSDGVVRAIGNGNATITATCGAYSATCEVMVSGITIDTSILYALPNPVTISTSADGIDTGVSLWASDIDFTIALKATSEASSVETTLFACNYGSDPYQGMGLAFNPKLNNANASIIYNSFTDVNVLFAYPSIYEGEVLFVITHTAKSGEYRFVYLYNRAVYSAVKQQQFMAHTNHLGIGVNDIWSTPVRPWNGSFEDFRILNRVMTDDEIAAYLDVTTSQLQKPTVLPFTENEISNTAEGAGFVTNPANYEDGKTYFRYHAGASYGFTWTNPDQQQGALTITMRGYSQYSDTLTTGILVYYTDGTNEKFNITHGATKTYVTNANKTVATIRGNYDFENWVLLDMDVMSIKANYPVSVS